MKATEREFIRFTRSSIIIYPKVAAKLNLKDGDIIYNAVLHDVNNSGILYANNKTNLNGDYDYVEINNEILVKAFHDTPVNPITEGNEKLARFLGWFQNDDRKEVWYEKGEFAIYVAYDTHNQHWRDLPFYRDWNYLMKVIDKIGSIVYNSENWKKKYSYIELLTQIFNTWLRKKEDKEGFNLMNSIEDIWRACVVYVDTYLEEE